MICTECGGFGNNDWRFVQTGDFTHKHISCVDDYPESTIAQDATELFFGFIAAFRHTQEFIRRGETECETALRATAHAFCCGYGQTGYDDDEVDMIISYMKNGAGTLGYRIEYDDELGISFISEQRERNITFIRPADAVSDFDCDALFHELIDSPELRDEDGSECIFLSQLDMCQRMCPCAGSDYCCWHVIADNLIAQYRKGGKTQMRLIKPEYDGVWAACYDHDMFIRVKLLGDNGRNDDIWLDM